MSTAEPPNNNQQVTTECGICFFFLSATGSNINLGEQEHAVSSCYFELASGIG